MNTNKIGFKWFSKNFVPCALDESSLSIGRVKTYSYTQILLNNLGENSYSINWCNDRRLLGKLGDYFQTKLLFER